MKTPFLKLIITISIISTLFSTASFADGLDGEFYVNQRWRDLTAGYSPTINPAFMLEKDQTSARVGLCSFLPDSSYLMELGIILPVGLYQSIGFSYMGKRARGSDVSGDNADDTASMVVLSYALNPWNKLTVGANLGVLFGNKSKQTYGYPFFDLGASYRFLHHPIYGSHLIGVSLQNIISPSLPFEHWQNQPVNLKFSWLAELWEGRINLGIDQNLTNLMSDETEFNFNSRIGFQRYPINAHFQIGDDYWGASGGLEFTVKKSHDLKLAFQYTSAFKETDHQSYTLYFDSDFGKKREEKYSRIMSLRP